tara:strand:- start:199 stop:318 length:120 start_codon:yes stop_codon:yes gene_type:complete
MQTDRAEALSPAALIHRILERAAEKSGGFDPFDSFNSFE